MSAPTLAEQRTAAPTPDPVERDRGRSPWIGIVAMTLVAAGLLVALVAVLLGTSRGLHLDQRLMESVGHSATAAMRITDWLTYVSVAGVALALAVCVVIAVARGRVALALAAVVLVAGANLSTRVLKQDVLERVDDARNTLPSGHTTVALSLGLAAIIVAPAAWRWVVVPLAGFAGTFVGAGTVVGQWHRPGDVLAAIAVCLGWSAVALAVATLMQREPAPARSGWAARSALALVGSALVGLCFVAWGLRPLDHDVQLVQAVIALAPIGLLIGVVCAWVSAHTERHLA